MNSTLHESPPASTVPSLPPGLARFQVKHWIQWVTNPVRFLDEQSRRFGDAFSVAGPLGQPSMVWLSEPDAIRDIFAGDPDVLHAGEANFIVEAVLGRKSLLMLDGDVHKRERRMMTPPFHGERMRAYGDTMRDLTTRAVDAWPMRKEFALLPEMQSITLDIILRAVFGLDEGPLFVRMRGLLRELLHLSTNPVLFALMTVIKPLVLQKVIGAIAEPMSHVGPRRFDWSRAVPGGRLYVLLREVDEVLRAEFARRRSDGSTGEREDVLSMLLAARDDEGRPMTDVQLRDEMMTLLVAGHETTATSLAWAFHHLLQNPETLARLRAELAPLTQQGPLRPEAVAGLEYLDAVVKETMRLTPVVPVVARVLKRDVRLGRHLLPAGVVAMPNIYLTHHRADIFPEPERFRPERFLEKKFGPNEFFPFGGGVRRCLGAAFATWEMKIVLAEVITKTTLRETRSDVKLARRGILFAPSNGVCVERLPG